MQQVRSHLDQARSQDAIQHLEVAHKSADSSEVFGVELAELYFQNDQQDDAERLLKTMMVDYPEMRGLSTFMHDVNFLVTTTKVP